MKKVLTAIIFIICVLSLSSCGKGNPAESNTPSNEPVAQTEQNSPKTDPPPAEAKDKDVTIEIVPPEGWSAVENPSLPVHYTKDTTSFMVRTEPYQSKDLDGVVEECKAAFKGVFDDVVVESVEELTIDGKDARKMVFTCKVSGLKMKFEYDFLFIGSKVYVITFGDMADSFDNLIADYEKIIQDIRFN